MEPPNKDTNKDNKNKRLSEFEWFEIETKVRQTVYDLMQPFQKRQIEEFAKLHEMRKTISDHTDNLKEHSYLLGLNQDIKPTYIHDLESQVVDMRSRFLGLELSTKENISNFVTKIGYFEERANDIGELITSFEQVRRDKISDKEQLLSLLNQQICSLSDSISNHEIQIATSISSIKSKQFQIDQQLLESQNKFRHYDVAVRNTTSAIEVVKRDLKTVEERQFEDRKYVENVDSRLLFLETDKELSMKFMAVVDTIHTKLGFFETYIDRYLPLFLQAQLSDTLHSFITDKQRRALCVYEEHAFETFNQQIISNSSHGLEANIRRCVSLVQQIIVRNKKYTIKLQVERRVKLGEKEYDVHVLDESLEDQKKVTVESNLPDERIKGVVMGERRELEEKIEEWMERQREEIRGQLGEWEGVSEIKFQKMAERFEQLESISNKAEVSNELSTKHLEQEITHLEDKMLTNRSDIEEMRGICKDVINFSSIINHIVIQDELDRQGIALFGLKETSKGPIKEKTQKHFHNESTLALDNNCLGCSGYPASTMSAFKMACLAYNPSNISVDGQSYKREEILDLSTRLLESLKVKFETGDRSQQHSSRAHNTKSGDRKQIDKTMSIPIYNTLELESKQMLPALKTKRDSTSHRKRSFHHSVHRDT